MGDEVAPPAPLVLAAVCRTVCGRGRSAGAIGTSRRARSRWFKGNTHTHTLNSDGDSSPDDVVRWYRDHKYNFLVLTDHNYLTSVDGLNALHGADDKFLVVKGEEVSSGFQSKPLHINALNPDRLVTASREGSERRRGAAEQRRCDPHGRRRAARQPSEFRLGDHRRRPRGPAQQQAVRGLQRPSRWSTTPGGSGHPSLEQTWDALLSRGILLFGLATDDAHEFKKLDDLSSSRPGMGWVMVRAEKLEAKAIVAAIERGDFYASTGVELADYEASATAITVKVKPRLWGSGPSENMWAGLPHHVHRQGWRGAPGGRGHRCHLHVQGLGRVRAREGDAVGRQGGLDAACDARRARR